jgi:hypothetical protein
MVTHWRGDLLFDSWVVILLRQTKNRVSGKKIMIVLAIVVLIYVLYYFLFPLVLEHVYGGDKQLPPEFEMTDRIVV